MVARVRWRINDRDLKAEIRRRLGIKDGFEQVNGLCTWNLDEKQLKKLEMIAVSPYNYLQIMEIW